MTRAFVGEGTAARRDGEPDAERGNDVLDGGVSPTPSGGATN